MSNHSLKVGKTSEKEIDSLFDFFNELSWLSDALDNKYLEDVELDADFEILSKFDKKNPEIFIQEIADHAKSLFYERVLTNCQVLLDNVADPNLSHLDWKPELKQLFAPKAFTDKNGNKFGDGDILQFTEHPKYLLKTGKLLVCWDEEFGCYGYKYEHSENKNRIKPFVSHDELKEDLLNHCELIGSIEKYIDLRSLFE